MRRQKKLALEQTTYTYRYNNTNISYTIWATKGEGNIVETVIFLGTIQIDNLVKWVAESCPPGTIVVQGVPHWLAQSDGSDIPEYMFHFTKCVLDALLKDFSLTRAHIIAESQAVPGILKLFTWKRYTHYAKKITLLQPLGLNTAAYQGAEELRIKVFRRRIIANLLHQFPTLMFDRRLRYNHRLANKMVGIALRNPKARAQYSSGLSYDAMSHLRHLASLHKDVVIICGANDKIFPAAEIRAALIENKITIPVHAIKGAPHSPLATRYGRRLLTAALNR